MPYRYHIYNFQDTPRAEHAKAEMATMEANGWSIHTAAPGYSELCVLWERVADKPEPDDGTVHVDWRMTQDEADQLFSVLRQHSDIPAIAALIEDEAIPPAEKAEPVPAE